MTTERWALVPVEATPEMEDRLWRPALTVDDAWRDMLAASPGAALLAEVLAARDALPGDPEGFNKRLGRLLAALDKLGPAAEGAT